MPSEQTLPDVLVLCPPTWSRLREYADSSYPIEACGLLYGRVGRSWAEVVVTRPSINSAGHADCYRIEAEEIWKGMREAQGQGLEILGFYHSHPHGDAVPSVIDSDEAWGDWYYLILTVGHGRSPVAAVWRWSGSSFVFVDLR